MRTTVLLLVLLFSMPSFACDCNSIVGYNESKVVFTGTVVKIERKTRPYIEYAITFKVCNIEKGNLKRKRIVVYTPCLMDACCGIDFQVKRKYRVYTVEEDGKLNTNLCTETTVVGK